MPAKRVLSSKRVTPLLSTAFIPPVEYFALIARGPVRMEACENYQKQSYRNRCRFLSAGGVESISVPVVHENGTFNLPIRDIKVDYKTPWTRRVERALDSAYRSAAYYDYFRDGLFGILDSRPQRLWDLNMDIIRYFAGALELDADIVLTSSYEPLGGPDDYREVIHPKRPDTILEDLGIRKPYFQVFGGKYGFCPDLSIMDLVFNEGPDGAALLR